jgi:replicative DNA helicase
LTEDINDVLMAGRLPNDPTEGAMIVSANVPRIKTVAEMLRGSQTRLLDKRQKRGCTTGHAGLDEETGGLIGGFVWVFGAISSWGKSSFLIKMADENIKAKKNFLIVTAEDDESLYSDRLLIRRSRVSADRFRKKTLTREEYDATAAVVAKGEDSPCFFDARGKSIEWTMERVKELIDEYDIDAAAFDYLQRFDSDKRATDRRMQINHIFNMIADTCKLKKVPAIIFSQITPDDKKPYPDKYSLRESKDVANGAEVVALGFTPEEDLARGDRLLATSRKKTIYLDKNKNGVPDQFFEMDWDNDCACFNTVLSQETKRYQEITGGAFDGFGDDPEEYDA